MHKISYCFFCGEEILGKISKEHIFPESFLSDNNLKNEKFRISSGEIITYSRLKVDSHSKCNNEFGSRYESKIINILRNLDVHSASLSSMHMSFTLVDGPSSEIRTTFTAWLAKLYFGLFWFQLNHHSTDDKTKEFLKEILEEHEFEMVRKSYKDGTGFFLPSSIYSVVLEEKNSIPFDFGSTIDGVFWIKIKDRLFMTALSDGQLSSNYLNNDMLLQFKAMQSANEHPYFYLWLVASLTSVRRNLPKSPSFAYSDDFIMNMSRMTLSSKSYDIDGDKVNSEAKVIYNDFLHTHIGLPLN